MCDFCDNPRCILTKKEVLERGAILENNAKGIMRLETDETPRTYSFDGVPAFYSLSALVPDEEEENPHSYMRFIFDEDTGCDGDWECNDVHNPLAFQTEKEFLEKFNEQHNS